MNNDAFESNTKGLNDFIKALGNSAPYAKVGILGGKSNRSAEGDSNATIGKRHEFGDGRLPIRSFLRVPLSDQFQKYVNKAQGFDEDAFKTVLQEKNLVPWIKKIGAIGVQIVLDAFRTGGFGKWTPSNMRRKKIHQTLVETTQLRDSIDFEVKE